MSDAAKKQGLLLAPISLSSDEKETILEHAERATQTREIIVKEMLKYNYSIDEISKIVGCFEEYIENLQLEESIKFKEELENEARIKTN